MSTLGKYAVVFTAHTGPLLRGLDQSTKRLGVFEQKVSKTSRIAGIASKSILAIGAAALAAGAFAIKMGAPFEKEMSRVKALTSATAGEMEILQAQAERLGATTEHTATQAAEAMSAFALAGFETRQIYDAMPATLNLASAGQISVGEAAGMAAKLMAGMGIEATDLGGAVDVMSKAFTSSNMDITQLSEAMSYVGPVARTAGFGLEATTATIMAVSNAGIQGQKAGAGMRRILLALASPSSMAASKMKELGVEVADAEGNMRTIPDIVGQFETSLRDLGTAEKLDVLGTIFGARGATVAAALIGAGSEAITEMETSLNSAGGTAQRIAETQLDNLAGSWVKLKSATEGFGITMFSVMKGPVRSAVDALTRFVQEGRTLFVIAFGIMEWAVNNWRDVLLLGFTKAQLGIVQFGAGFWHLFGTKIPAWLSWVAENWRDIWTTMGDWTLAVMTNLSGNIVEILKNIPGLIAGTVDFADLWTPLTEGFRTSIKELPEIPAREATAIEQALQKDIADMRTRLGTDLSTTLAARLKTTGEDVEALTSGEGVKIAMTPDTEETMQNLADAMSGKTAALEMGSAGAYSAVMTATFGRSEKFLEVIARDMGKVADNTRRQADAVGAGAADDEYDIGD